VVKGRQAAKIRDRMRFSQRCEVNTERKGVGRGEDKRERERQSTNQYAYQVAIIITF